MSSCLNLPRPCILLAVTGITSCPGTRMGGREKLPLRTSVGYVFMAMSLCSMISLYSTYNEGPEPPSDSVVGSDQLLQVLSGTEPIKLRTSHSSSYLVVRLSLIVAWGLYMHRVLGQTGGWRRACRSVRIGNVMRCDVTMPHSIVFAFCSHWVIQLPKS